jgi:hypothetical protein
VVKHFKNERLLSQVANYDGNKSFQKLFDYEDFCQANQFIQTLERRRCEGRSFVRQPLQAGSRDRGTRATTFLVISSMVKNAEHPVVPKLCIFATTVLTTQGLQFEQMFAIILLTPWVNNIDNLGHHLQNKEAAKRMQRF